MNINFELYRIFYIVASCKSITEASKKLMISQPAVTKAIKNLENQLSGTLFTRSKSGIKLTEEGKSFYNYIRPAIKQIYNAENQFSNITKLDTGSIKIGTSNTILKYFLISYLKEFSEKFPKIDISVEESYTPNLINMVKNGSIDIAVIYAADNDEKLENLKVHKCKKLHYCLIGNNEYKHYLNKKVNFSELKDESLVLNNINSSQNDLILGNNDQKYRTHINLASHSLVYEFVKQGFGMGIVIKEFIEEDLKNKKLIEINLKNDFKPLNLVLITNKNDFPNYATMALINIIIKDSQF